MARIVYTILEIRESQYTCAHYEGVDVAYMCALETAMQGCEISHELCIAEPERGEIHIKRGDLDLLIKLNETKRFLWREPTCFHGICPTNALLILPYKT